MTRCDVCPKPGHYHGDQCWVPKEIEEQTMTQGYGRRILHYDLNPYSREPIKIDRVTSVAMVEVIAGNHSNQTGDPLVVRVWVEHPGMNEPGDFPSFLLRGVVNDGAYSNKWTHVGSVRFTHEVFHVVVKVE